MASAWISEGDDEVELLVVEAKFAKFPVRLVSANRPQENDQLERKSKFWSRLGIEVDDAINSDCGFILQMDGNLHLGPDFLPGDPHSCNRNGKLFEII